MKIGFSVSPDSPSLPPFFFLFFERPPRGHEAWTFTALKQAVGALPAGIPIGTKYLHTYSNVQVIDILRGIGFNKKTFE